MSSYETTKLVAFTAIIALAGLLIVIIGSHTLFPELLFYSIVMILIGIIVIFVAYAFLWERSRRYVSMRLWKRKMNRLARNNFDEFTGFVDRFTSLGEFKDTTKGTIKILQFLFKLGIKEFGPLIATRVEDFGTILQSPLNDFQQRLRSLHWQKKEITYELLSCLAKEFESYIKLHKRLYVDFAVAQARRISLDSIPQEIKSVYSDYKDDYNQFIIAYTEFAERGSKVGLSIFDKQLQKASEL
jgi:hypothetical protein